MQAEMASNGTVALLKEGTVLVPPPPDGQVSTNTPEVDSLAADTPRQEGAVPSTPTALPEVSPSVPESVAHRETPEDVKTQLLTYCDRPGDKKPYKGTTFGLYREAVKWGAQYMRLDPDRFPHDSSPGEMRMPRTALVAAARWYARMSCARGQEATYFGG